MTHEVIIIGLGNIGMLYDYNSCTEDRILSLSAAFNYHDKFHLSCGVDVDSKNRKKFTKKFSSPAYGNLEEALSKHSADIIVISTSTNNHYSTFKKVINRKSIKSILCEKPLSLNYLESEEMINLAEKNNIALFVNYSRRCDLGIIKINDMISNGEIQNPCKGICWYSNGLYNNGSHFINLIEYWFGEANKYTIISKGKSNTDSDIQPDFTIEFNDAKFLFINTDINNYIHNSIEVLANNGSFYYERSNIKWRPAKHDNDYPQFNTLYNEPELIQCDNKKMQYQVVSQLYNYLIDKPTSICTGKQALSTLHIINEINKAYG